MEENKNFIFNEKLDVEIFEVFYEDDLEYVVDFFEMFFDFMVEEFRFLKGFIEVEDWVIVKGFVYKLKLIFFMVGLFIVEFKMMEIEYLVM